MSDYNYPKPINTPMKLRDILQIHEDDGGGASAGATTSADIAGVAYPLFVRGRTRKDKRKNARAAVGQKYNAGPAGVGTGVYEDEVGEAHTLNSDSVIYRLDTEHPMSDTEVAVLGGAGRYTLAGLRDKARREAKTLSDDLTSDHGGSFRGAAHNIKQLTNTLNTIVAAYNELKRIRSKGGRGSRGITDEDKNFVRECLTTLENYSKIVDRAIKISSRVDEAMKNGKMHSNHAGSIRGMYHLNTDPAYGFYRWAIHVAGNKGGDSISLGPNAGPFAYAYTEEEGEMIRKAVKAVTGKNATEMTGGKSTEPADTNKKSTMPTIDWKKVK